MTFQDFAAFHAPALEADEVRFNVPLSIIAAALANLPADLRYWTLGGPGACAIEWPGRPIQLAALDEAACKKLARETQGLSYAGVAGAGDTARWFVEEASALGLVFPHSIPLSIQALTRPPIYPSAAGAPRMATEADAHTLLAWIGEFHREAVPHDLPPLLEKIVKDTVGGRYLLWTVDGEPVSLAGFARSLKTTRGIAPVFTPKDKRGRGYAGAVTATLCERIFAEGKTSACLYTDLRNPISNRCYAKIGFRQHCVAWDYIRAQ
jgi:RimJ/RimL family protein N-acetyltransferase